MQQIIEYANIIFEELSLVVTNLFSEPMLLFAGLGILLLVLVILMLVKRRRRRPVDSDGDGDGEFLEVGPEPVIVYRRTSEQEEESEEESEPEAEPEAEAAEPEPELEEEPQPSPDQQPIPNTEATPEPAGLEPFTESEPVPPVDFEPEPQPDGPVRPSPMPEPVTYEPLPFLESELASDTLHLLTRQGYKLDKVVYHGRFGADFILTKADIRTYVQIKDWKKKLTANGVQEVFAYANSNSCNQIIIVTAASFDRSAEKAAGRMGVLLWNKKNLKKLQKDPLQLDDETTATK